MKLLLFTIAIFLTSLQMSYSQSKRFTKELQKQEEQQKKDFPPPLVEPFPKGSLGDKIQTLYKEQARNACKITRNDERLFIPREIISGYGEDRLRGTMIFDVSASANNLLFLALSPSDVLRITEGTFNEQDHIIAKRIIGINDNLIDFGQSVLTPIDGFPSFFYQKSCGSYFVGDIESEVNAPVAELKASLKAEAKKQTSITTLTGNFFSPLYLILRQNTAKSIYAHLLIWELYLEDFKNNRNNNEHLHNNGKYISEFKATMTYRAIDSDQSISMNGRLSTGVSLGIFSAKGNISAGNENKVAFNLKDFRTSIHKLPNNNLNWDLSDLPKFDKINKKLQNSFAFTTQPSMTGFATHLLPTEITRTIVGIPASLCDATSWQVSQDGFDTNIWKEKPNVISTFTEAKENKSEFPECTCKITGFIKKEAIDRAVASNKFINLSLKLNHNSEILGQKLTFDISELSVKVTDNPKISIVNSESVNVQREATTIANKVSYKYPIQFTVNSTGIQLTEPYSISNIEIEYVNKENQNLSITDAPIVQGNSISFNIKTPEKPQNYVSQGELIIPIKIKFNIEIKGGITTQLVTNTINLNLPNLVEKLDIQSNVKE